ncbi:MAG: glycogen-binding domain-containing protein [Verrucomicrobia bacterium]|nr:glycogen-binding domain-containing protein [Verrucomicrobiota bacterium]
MKTKSKSAAKGCVRLRLTHLAAQQVCVAGSFNDWHPTVTPMIRLDDRQWAKELALPPGRYEYRFVVDGVWVDDPEATELIPNPFGSANAVLEVRPVAPAPSVRSDSPGRKTRKTTLPAARVSGGRGVLTGGVVVSR